MIMVSLLTCLVSPPVARGPLVPLAPQEKVGCTDGFSGTEHRRETFSQHIPITNMCYGYNGSRSQALDSKGYSPTQGPLVVMGY